MPRAIMSRPWCLKLVCGLGITFGCRTPSPGTAVQATTPDQGAAAEFRMGLNDVSILFPIADEQDLARLPRLSDSGERGPYIDAKAMDKIGALAFNADNHAGSTKGLRSLNPKFYVPIAVRVDPCSPQITEDDSQCQRQLRIVWQEDNIGLGGDAGDNALHTIYQLTPDEFTSLIKGLARLKSAAPFDYTAAPLAPHPVIAKEKIKGPYAQGVLSLVKKYAGRSNLVQVAFALVTVRDEQWVFGLLDTSNGKITTQKLPTVSKPIQIVDFQFQDSASIVPTPPFAAKDSLAAYAEAGEWTAATVNTLARIENPRLNNTQTTDCTSCHLAAGARLDIASTLAGGDKTADDFKSSHWNLSSANILPLERQSIHNFSYLGEFASINSRTVNESALVADWINTHIPLSKP